MHFIWYSKTFFLFYLASNILGIEWIGKIMDLFTSGSTISVLFVLILARNSQWHSPDRKNLKPAVKEFDWMLLKILYKTIKFNGLRTAILIYFRSACWIVVKLHIKKSKIYSYPNYHALPWSQSYPPPPKKPLKTPTIKPSDLILLFCMTIRELWALAAPEL